MNVTTERRAGIYMIRNSVTDDRYYGSSVNLRQRSMNHRSQLRGGTHGNRRMQNSWNKHGEAAFAFTALAVLERADTLATEDRLLARHFGQDGCMNAGTNATAPMLGLRHSAETKAKMAESNRGKKRSPAFCAASRARNIGKVVSLETRAKIAAAKRGVRHTPEARARMSASQRHSKKVWTPEMREEMSRRWKGRTFSPEQRAAISATKKAQGLTGGKDTPETKARKSAAQRGRVITPEHRTKLSESVRAHFARKRALLVAA